MKKYLCYPLFICFLLLLFPIIQVEAACQHEWIVLDEAQPTCGKDGYQWKICPLCGVEENITIPATRQHKWGNWRTIEKANCLWAGLRERNCKVCGFPQHQQIPKTKATASEKQVISSTKKFFTYAKNYNAAKIKKCFVKPSKIGVFSSKKYKAKFIRKYNKKYLKYEIDDIRVSKKSATIKVSCSYYDAENAFYNSMGDLVKYISKHPKASDKQLDKYQYGRIVKWNKYFGKEISEKTLTIKFKKSGSSWKIVSMPKALDNAIHCNYTNAYNDYFN